MHVVDVCITSWDLQWFVCFSQVAPYSSVFTWKYIEVYTDWKCVLWTEEGQNNKKYAEQACKETIFAAVLLCKAILTSQHNYSDVIWRKLSCDFTKHNICWTLWLNNEKKKSKNHIVNNVLIHWWTTII